MLTLSSMENLIVQCNHKDASDYVRTNFCPIIYTRQKKKRNSKIFPLSLPFNAKMLIVIKYLVLIKSRQNSAVA